MTYQPCCWTCVSGLFDRRRTWSVGRCALHVSEEHADLSHRLPNAFWMDINKGTFEVDFEEFWLSHAHRYFGDVVTVEIATGEQNVFINQERCREMHRVMCEIARAGTRLITPTHLCEQHKEREHAVRRVPDNPQSSGTE